MSSSIPGQCCPVALSGAWLSAFVCLACRTCIETMKGGNLTLRCLIGCSLGDPSICLGFQSRTADEEKEHRGTSRLAGPSLLSLPPALLGSQPRSMPAGCWRLCRHGRCTFMFVCVHSCPYSEDSFVPIQLHSLSQKPERVKMDIKGAVSTSKTICS